MSHKTNNTTNTSNNTLINIKYLSTHYQQTSENITLNTNKKISPANIIWQNDNTPFSKNFDDIYFSTANGVAETEYVFIKNNFLKERFAKFLNFNIAETGFGSGLNFVSTWKLWKENFTGQQHLNYFTFEMHPFTKYDLEKISQLLPSFSCYYTQIIANYPPMTYGAHHINFFEDNISLIIYFGDANLLIDSLIDNSIDAWFLDGFTPCKNQQLWKSSLINKIANKTASNGTFSTFTAASQVRRDLITAGFKVEKIKGFAKKREMMRGHIIK